MRTSECTLARSRVLSGRRRMPVREGPSRACNVERMFGAFVMVVTVTTTGAPAPRSLHLYMMRVVALVNALAGSANAGLGAERWADGRTRRKAGASGCI